MLDLRRVPGSDLERAESADIDRLRASEWRLPEHYLQFLEHVGFGSLGDGGFIVYSGPVEASEIFGERPDLPRNLLLLGDDMAGYHVGLLPNEGGWMLVELDHAEPPAATRSVHSTLQEFLGDWFQYEQPNNRDAADAARAPGC